MVEPVPQNIRDEARRWHVRRGRGDPDVEKRCAEWLESDEMHRRAYDQIEGVWDRLSLITETETGQTRKLPRAPFHMRRATRIGCGATALAAFVGILVLGAADRVGTPAFVSPAQAAIYRTGLGEIRKVGLPGGVQMTLDTESIVKSDRREPRSFELVQGRARFAVTGERQGVIVLAAGRKIRAGDATFDVSLVGMHPQVGSLRGDVYLDNRLISGREVIELQRNGDHSVVPETVQTLRPGQTRWVEGMLGFDGEPLVNAIAMVNRYNRLQIKTRDLDTASLKVTGAFSAAKPRAFAEAIAATFGFDLEVSGTDTLVLGPKGK